MLQERSDEEILISKQSGALWSRRRQELALWLERPKVVLHPKQTMLLEGEEVDAELYRSLSLLREKRVCTEFSCAGVSPLDEPEEHSLYAYVTLYADDRAERFVQLAMGMMRRRLLVTYEPGRGRYDLSSFFLGHNRSFCRWIEHCAERFTMNE